MSTQKEQNDLNAARDILFNLYMSWNKNDLVEYLIDKYSDSEIKEIVEHLNNDNK